MIGEEVSPTTAEEDSMSSK
jgi:hypothetical protein